MRRSLLNPTCMGLLTRFCKLLTPLHHPLSFQHLPPPLRSLASEGSTASRPGEHPVCSLPPSLRWGGAGALPSMHSTSAADPQRWARLPVLAGVRHPYAAPRNALRACRAPDSSAAAVISVGGLARRCPLTPLVAAMATPPKRGRLEGQDQEDRGRGQHR